MSTFPLEIYTPERTFFKGIAEYLTVTAQDGEAGIMYRTAPSVIALKAGFLRITLENGEIREAASDAGFAEIRPEGVIVLTQTAEWPEEIEVNRVNREIERANERLRQKKSMVEYKLGQLSLARAFARLQVKSKHGDDNNV